MRVSEIQRRRSMPTEAQPVPLRRTVGWLLVAAAIAAAIYLYFRFSGALTPILLS